MFFRGTSLVVFHPYVSGHHIHFLIDKGVATDIIHERVCASAQTPDGEKISIEVTRNCLGALDTFYSKSIISP